MSTERQQCSECGHSNPPAWLICANCGAKLSRGQAASSRTAASRTGPSRPRPSPATSSAQPNYSPPASQSGGCWKGFEQGCGFGCGLVAFIVLLFMFFAYLGSIPSTSGGSSNGASAIPGVTLRQYNRLQTGMTLPEVVSILGPNGAENARSSVAETVIASYVWQNTDGSNLMITMQGGRLVQKVQAGLR